METNDKVLLDNYVLNYDKLFALQVDDLCLCNDFATTFIVDSIYNIASFKFNPRTSSGFMLAIVPQNVQILLRDYLDLYRAGDEDMFDKIMKFASYFADCCNFEDDQLRHAALEFVKLYLRTFSRNSEFIIEPSSYNYLGEGQMKSLKITATKNVHTGHVIDDLLMFTKCVNGMPTRWESYSIHGQYIGVGPLMYANHSCRQNNAEYVGHWTSDDKFRFVWASSLFIQESNEITVNYGSEYFEAMRCECENCRPKTLTRFGLRIRRKK